MEGAPHEYKEHVGSCIECGNSPVNHLSTYLTHTFAVWSSRSPDGKQGIRRWFDAQVSLLAPHVDALVYGFFAVLPITRFSREVERAATYRSQVIWEEAERRGIRMEQMTLLGAYVDIYRARINSSWFYFQSLPIPARYESADVGWIDDKHALKEALSKAGIAVPRTVSVTSLAEVRRAAAQLASPFVVKPRAGSRGRHTTVGVRTTEDAERAFRVAQQLCRYVALEDCLTGGVCRATVVGGRLVGFLQGFPPRVMGDGVASIRELVARANSERHERVQPIEISDEHVRFLQRAGYTLDSVVPHGDIVSLTHRTGRLFGGTTRELLGAEHPALRAHLERAATILGIPVVGIDLIIEDPTKDPDQQTWGIIEANTLPYIDLHYLPLEGQPSNVAAAVWDLWGTIS